MRNLARKDGRLSDGDTGVNGGGAEVAQSKNQLLEPILYEYLILDEMDILTLSQVLMNLPTP